MMVPRLTPSEQENFKKNIDPHLEYFAAEGLRTLCCASAVIDEKVMRLQRCRWMKSHGYFRLTRRGAFDSTRPILLWTTERAR